MSSKDVKPTEEFMLQILKREFLQEYFPDYQTSHDIDPPDFYIKTGKRCIALEMSRLYNQTHVIPDTSLLQASAFYKSQSAFLPCSHQLKDRYIKVNYCLIVFVQPLFLLYMQTVIGIVLYISNKNWTMDSVSSSFVNTHLRLS